tara:strand:- start:483 stop:1250 length:768 start_codon:yes stop_codon:yes gene_type:complete
MAKLNIKKFNQTGRKAFYDLIVQSQSETFESLDKDNFLDLACNLQVTEKVPHAGVVNSDVDLGDTKYTMSQYFYDKLPNFDSTHILLDHGVWEWLACFHLTNFVRTRAREQSDTGFVPPLNSKWLIVQNSGGWYDTRHCIRDFIIYYHKYKDESKVLLSGTINEFGEVSSQFFVNEFPTVNSNLVKFVNEFYFDGFDENGNPKLKNKLASTNTTPTSAYWVKIRNNRLTSAFDLEQMSYTDYKKQMLKKIPLPNR